MAVKPHWYSAHAIFVFEVVTGRQNTFTVIENILLVRANSPAAALKRALAVARRSQPNNPSLTVDGRPARQSFQGIRKIVECAADANDSISKDGLVSILRVGTEATYLKYRVVGRSSLKRLLSGKETSVVVEE